MSYSYEKERSGLFTERGSENFIRIRDKVKAILKTAGAFRLQEIGIMSWTDIACIDRMVEMEEIVELVRDCVGQHRVFTTKN